MSLRANRTGWWLALADSDAAAGYEKATNRSMDAREKIIETAMRLFSTQATFMPSCAARMAAKLSAPCCFQRAGRR